MTIPTQHRNVVRSADEVHTHVTGDIIGYGGGGGGSAFTWRGAYSSGYGTYALNDVVGFGGSSYICTTATALDPSAAPGDWGLMAQDGTAGAAGAAGATGATGSTGATGAAGAAGATGPGVPVAGSTGQVLAKNSGTDYDTHWVTPSGGGGGDWTFRGNWSSGTTYATNDLVQYAGGLWIAASTPTVGTAPSTVSSTSVLGKSVSAASAAWGASVAQEFTVSAACVVNQVTIESEGSIAIGSTFDIRTTKTGSPIATATVSATIASGTKATLTLSTSASLAASTTYYLVASSTDAGYAAPSNSGIVATQHAWYGSGFSTDAGTGSATYFELVTVVSPVWSLMEQDMPAGGTTGQVLEKNSGTDYDASWTTPASGGGIDFEGTWASGTTYTTDQVVSYNGALYVATAGSTGVTPGAVGGSTTVGALDSASPGSSSWGDAHEAQAFTVSANTTVTGIELYPASNVLPSGTVVGIASALGGTPTYLGSYTLTAASAMGTWVPFTLNTPAALVAGTTYYVTVIVPSGNAAAYVNTANVLTGIVATAPGTLYYGSTFGSTFAANMPFRLDAVAATSWALMQQDMPSGGTTGQVLEKNSGTDYDASWATPASGGGIDFQGAWGTGTAYTTDQVVSYNGALYIAVSASTGAIPGAAGGTPVLSGSINTSGTPTGNFGSYPLAQTFTVSSGQVVTAVAISAYNPLPVGAQIGIASAVGSSVTWLAYTTLTVASATGWLQYSLPTNVTLTAGVTYYLVVTGSPGASYMNFVGVLAGAISTDPSVLYGTSYGSSLSSVSMMWRIYAPGATAWELMQQDMPAGGTAGQVLTKSSSTDYAASWATPVAKQFASAYQHTAQSIATATWTSLTLDAEVSGLDPSSLHSVTTNTSRITAAVAGVYEVSGLIVFSGTHVTGRRGAGYKINGTLQSQVNIKDCSAAGSSVAPSPTLLIAMSVGDYVELAAYQDCGSALSTNADSSQLNLVQIA